MATSGTVKGNLVGVYVQDGDADGDTDIDLIARDQCVVQHEQRID